MNFAYFDCFSGISGDMVLGACLDLGLDLAQLKQELGKLGLSGFELQVDKVKRRGLAGTKVTVQVEETKQPHRHLGTITDIISRSALNEQVKEKSIQIFTRLAAAEAKIHATSLEKVHFHEVGSIDAIVDIVGSVICLDMLGITKLMCSRINVGSGFVRCQHGIIPVPAPATLELLRGVPIYSFECEEELVTPTGAALITTLCQEFGPLPNISVDKIGYGAGERELAIPNLLRILVG